jgi:hypothetical protein
MCYANAGGQIATGNAGWGLQFRFAVYAGWSRVPEFWALGVSAAMKSEYAKPADVFRFAAGCVVVGFLSAVVYLLFRQNSDVRGATGGVGFMASLVGSGVAFWFALRGRERKLIVIALLSVLPLGFWCWIIYSVLHGS